MCSLEKKAGNVYVLTLLGDGEHRINPAFVDSILAALCTLPTSASALVTTNHGKFFSNGLDLSFPSRSVVGYKFHQLLQTFLHLPMPTIAAVSGHACAGGFIFALAHDYLLMRNDRGFLYMSEIDVGIVLTPAAMDLVRYKMPPLAFRDSVLSGIKYTAEKALAAGIIDSVHEDAERTLEAALEHGRKLVGRNWNPNFYQAMRAAMYPKVYQELNNYLKPQNSPTSKL